MLIKSADNRSADIAVLKALLKEPELTPDQKQAILDELDDLEKGAWGEHDAAYLLNLNFSSSDKHLLFHDLQIVLSDDRTAQIDHLLVNSFQDFYILESKNWMQLNVDQLGACSTGHHRHDGELSPLEQCQHNAFILSRVFELDPELRALAPRPRIIPRVLVAPRCILNAPHHQEWYVRADLFNTQRAKDKETLSLVKNVFDFPRLTTHKNLLKIGQALSALHNPRTTDWRKRFGLTPPPPKGYMSAEELLATVEGLVEYVPRWGDDWLVVSFPPGLPPLAIVKALKAAGYHSNKHQGEWVWSYKEDAKPPEPENRWL